MGNRQRLATILSLLWGFLIVGLVSNTALGATVASASVTPSLSAAATPEDRDKNNGGTPTAQAQDDELFVVSLSSNERYAVDANGLEPVKRLTAEQVREEYANGPNGPVEEEVRKIFIHDIGVNPNALMLHYNATPDMPHEIKSVNDLVEGGKVEDGAKYSKEGEARYNELKPKLETEAAITITPEVKYDAVNTGVGPNGPTYSQGVSGDKTGVDIEYADGKDGLTGYSVLARCKNVTTSAPPAGVKPGYTDEHFGIGTGYGPPPEKPVCVRVCTPPPPPPCEGDKCNPEPPCVDQPGKPCEPPIDECPELPGEQEPGTDCEPPVDECPELPGNQPEGTECEEDACPELEGNQPEGYECEPPVDECPEIPGEQPEGTDCEPPTDACPEIPGEQPEGTDCEPPTDACPEIDGNQPPGTDCEQQEPPKCEDLEPSDDGYCGTPNDGAEQQDPQNNDPGTTDPAPGYEEGSAEQNDQQQGDPCAGATCGDVPTDAGTEVDNSDQGGEAPAPPVVTPEEQPQADPQPQPNPDYDGSAPTTNPDNGTGGSDAGDPPADTPAQNDDGANSGDPLGDLPIAA